MEVVGLSFLSTLQSLLGSVFDAVLVPVIQDVAGILINMAGSLIQEILSGFLLELFIILLKLIYFMEQIFNIFSGVSPVKVTDASKSAASMTLLEYFFQLDDVKRAFLLITMIAVVLAFLATIVAVGKSISDMALEMKHPISQVLRQSVKAAVSFMLIPFVCLFVLQMATKLTVVVNNSMNASTGNVSMSDTIFISCASDGAKTAAIREDYGKNQKYENANKVKEDFDITKINYVMGYISAALVAIVMLVAILQFIRRIVEILLLYLAAPFFVATMPLDEGARFKEWRDHFVARMFSAFGPIMMMKVYFLVVPVLTSSEVNYNMSSWMESSVKLFLVIGGAYAVFKSQHMLTSILNPLAAGSMAESGFLAAMIGGKMGQAVRGASGKGGKKPKGKSGGQSGAASQYQTKSQAFTGK